VIVIHHFSFFLLFSPLQDDLVATTFLKFDKVPLLVEGTDVKRPPPGTGYTLPEKALTQWLLLYGPRGMLENEKAMQMRKVS
jgi:hypothetical protein